MSLDSDPTDWPESMPELREIDNLLRCNICFEYLNTAMVLPVCSHNYCSLCIRRFMNYKSQCPTCNTAVIEPEIKNNRILDSLVKNFLAIRSRVLNAVKTDRIPNTTIAATNTTTGSTVTNTAITPTLETDPKPSTSSSSKETVVSLHYKEDIPVHSKKLMSPRKARLDKSPPCTLNSFLQQRSPDGCQGNTTSHTEDGDVSIIENPLSPNTETSAPKAECPVCGVSVLERRINEHLDRCLASSAKKESLRSSASRKPLPKLVYNLMSDKELKKKMKEYGLSVQGNRQVLIKRLQEFTLLYNSECDSENPKSVSAIVKELEKTEKTKTQLTGNVKQKKLTFEKGESEEDMAKKKQEYAKAHKSQFDSLIAKARNAMKQKSRKKTETATNVDEGTSTSTSQTDTTQTLQMDTTQSTTSTNIDLAMSLPGPSSSCNGRTENDKSVFDKEEDTHIGFKDDENNLTDGNNLPSVRHTQDIGDKESIESGGNNYEQPNSSVPATSGLTNFADSDSDFSASAVQKTMKPKGNSKTTKKGRKAKKGRKKDEVCLDDELANVEVREPVLEIKMAEVMEDLVNEHEDPEENDSPGSPSIFENATQPSSGASSPIFGPGLDLGSELGKDPENDIGNELDIGHSNHSPQSTPSLGFGVMDTASDIGNHSDVLFDVKESPVRSPPTRRTLRKRKNDFTDSVNSDNASSSGEVGTTRRKRRKATKK